MEQSFCASRSRTTALVGSCRAGPSSAMFRPLKVTAWARAGFPFGGLRNSRSYTGELGSTQDFAHLGKAPHGQTARQKGQQISGVAWRAFAVYVSADQPQPEKEQCMRTRAQGRGDE
jgi:hypothetical protein